MKKILLTAIMGLMAVCSMAQDKVYVHSDGIAYPFDINKVTEINFIQGSDILAEEPLVITGDVVEVGVAQATIAAKAVVSSLSADYRVGILYCEEKDYVASNFVYSKYDDHKDADWVSAEYSVVLNSLSAETKYYYRAYAYNGEKNLYGEVKTFTTNELILTEGDWIDLGLSVKWASFNLGATAPELSGSFYAWGETETKSNYSESTSLYYGVEGMEDIAGIDGLDVARTLLGEGYRMPTQSEFSELYNNCDWYWLKYKGVNGYFVQSRSNSNGIFLPAAGCRLGEDLYNEGSFGYYWSSTPYTDDAVSAYNLYFYSGYVDPYSGSDNRHLGFPIRPVKDLTINDIADAFKTKHATVLALDVKDVTVDDRKPVSKALSEYSKLSSEAQALLADEKAKLDALKEAIPSGAPSRVTFVQLYKNGPKWASMNIGANSVTDAGLYYWWGDIEGHAIDENPAYNFYSDNAEITSYGNNDGYVADGKLMAEKDAATQQWGAAYRMPTSTDFEDLASNCDWSWQENYNGVEGANGYLVTGRGDYADKSIFLPAAGCRNEDYLHYEGEGFYWSSNPFSGDNSYTYRLGFSRYGNNPYDFGNRYDGFPIRAVEDVTIEERVTFVQLYENGPKWANMNIGATSVTDAGLYFWWGDIEGHAKDESPKFNFNFDNAAITSWDNNEDYVADGKLAAEKDAATQLWGAGYRMPTQAEFEDLYNKCTWTWKTNYNGVEGVNGYLVTGKGDYAGNSIFLPAAGSRDGEDLNREGSSGIYWSSTPSTGNADYAYTLYFDSGFVNPDDYGIHFFGDSVRPVSE
ncbi:MAG: hypothetical protein MJZ15_02765 [Bacteroidales bacterium]|nr:hypothetical protein [Bacteroidales bacterium]